MSQLLICEVFCLRVIHGSNSKSCEETIGKKFSEGIKIFGNFPIFFAISHEDLKIR